MKLTVQKPALAGILARLRGTGGESAAGALEKAVGHKYIKRWPKKTGKGWDYLYPEDLIKQPIKKLIELFGFTKEKFEKNYTENNIKQDF
jgi:hypothetical protein